MCSSDLRYDEATGETLLMRVKEGSADYRYFPEPDLPIFEIEDAWIEQVRSSLPAFPKERREKYVGDYGLSDYDAKQLTATKAVSDFFEAALAAGGDAKAVSNWLQGDVAQYLNAEGKTISESTRCGPARLARPCTKSTPACCKSWR